MNKYRRRTAFVGVGALTAGLLLTSPQSAEAANLVLNPGFETAGGDGMPYCWEKSGGATTTLISPRLRMPTRVRRP